MKDHTNTPPQNWPDSPAFQSILTRLLLGEANQKDYPGAQRIAEKLATGCWVVTTHAAPQIWLESEFYNFMEVTSDVPDAVGVIALRLKADVWGSMLIMDQVSALQKAAVAKMAEAREYAESISALHAYINAIWESKARPLAATRM